MTPELAALAAERDRLRAIVVEVAQATFSGTRKIRNQTTMALKAELVEDELRQMSAHLDDSHSDPRTDIHGAGRQ